MSTAQQAVTVAANNLQQAKAAIRAERVDDAKRELKQLRADAKALRAELATITRRVRTGDMTVTGARAELYKIDATIATLRSNRRKDLLADPADVEQEIAAWQEHRKEVFARLEAGMALTEGRTRAIDIAKELERLQHVAANLRNLIEHGGQLRAGWEGSLNYVR